MINSTEKMSENEDNAASSNDSNDLSSSPEPEDLRRSSRGSQSKFNQARDSIIRTLSFSKTLNRSNSKYIKVLGASNEELLNLKPSGPSEEKQEFIKVIFGSSNDLKSKKKKSNFSLHKYIFILCMIIMLVILYMIYLCAIMYKDYKIASERRTIFGESEIKQLTKCIDGVIIIPEFKNLYNLPVFEENSIYNSIRLKSKVRFVMSSSLLFDCLSDINKKIYNCKNYMKKCDCYFEEEARRQIYNQGFHGLYYNYIFDNKGALYKGRPLSSNFKEEFFTQNHDNLLIVGIPDCNHYSYDKFNFTQTLTVFQNCLETSGLLTTDYKLEFYKTCQNKVFTEEFHKLNRDKIIINNNYNLNFDEYYKFIRGDFVQHSKRVDYSKYNMSFIDCEGKY